MDADTLYKDVQKLLGEPFALEFSDFVRKLRNNLMVVSCVALAVVFADIRINEGSAIFGLVLTGVTDKLVYWSLLLFITYSLVHFCWNAWDLFLEWKMRLTGCAKMDASFQHEASDYAGDPRNSTLHNWWRARAGSLDIRSNSFAALDEMVAELPIFMKYVSELPFDDVRNRMATWETRLQRLQDLLASEEALWKSQRIRASLERFDNLSFYFWKSQSMRWLIIELSLPVALGAFAFIAVVGKLLTAY